MQTMKVKVLFMKKLILSICVLLLISACSDAKNNSDAVKKNEKQVVCKLDESDQAGVEVTYTYDEDKNITKIHNVSYLQFSDDELAEASLDDYYKQIVERYKEAEGTSGVEIKITKNEDKKRVEMDVVIQIDIYNLEEDILNVTNDGEMDNVEDLIGLYNAMGIYSCGEIK